MKKLLSSSLSTLYHAGRSMFGVKDRGLRILCYHKVNGVDRDYIAVSTENFRKQMEYLSANGYKTVSLAACLKLDSIPEKGVAVTFDDGYMDNYDFAFPIMKRLGFTGTIFCVAERVASPGYLGMRQIEEMSRAGFEFGSHTLSHPHLKSIADAAKTREITGSKTELEQLFGMPVKYFCYPYGEYDDASVELARSSGYAAAVSNRPGSNGAGEDLHLLKRTEIAFADTLFDFEKKLSGAYDPLHQALHAVRGRA